ncbi:MAG: 4'-phosphopantetheinyl transferase superfamily protein [Chloroflexota bacterium]
MTNYSESRSRIRSALLSQPLTDSDIHVWCASLNVSPQDLSYYSSLLSQDEVDRAKRFYFDKDRDHFIVVRGLLRTILSNYLNQEPAQIEFVYGQFGKPAIKSGQSDKVLEFNLSHSKDLALYAFNWNRRIGIDIEYMIPMADMDNFAEQFFTPRETALINTLSGAQKEDAFFKTWTCKEAFLKANGSGLTVPINQVEIYFETDEIVALSSIGDDREQATHWRLDLFNKLPGYRAALAVEGLDGQVIFRRLKDHAI